MTREEELVEVARDAVRWFNNRLGGTGRNGSYDDLSIARRLTRILAGYADIPLTRDVDRQAESREARHQRVVKEEIHAYLDRQEASK